MSGVMDLRTELMTCWVEEGSVLLVRVGLEDCEAMCVSRSSRRDVKADRLCGVMVLRSASKAVGEAMR